MAEAAGLDQSRVEVIHQPEPNAAARHAVALVRAGKADVLMKGTLQTAELLHAVVDKAEGISRGGVMSHLAFEEVDSYHKFFAITDSGMLLSPDLEQKKQLIQNAVDTFHALGNDCPKVAVLAAAETVNPKIQASVDAAALEQWQKEGGIGGCVIEGPLSYDLAMDRRSVEQKGWKGAVAGDADILVVPDLVSGNLLGKALAFSGGAKMAGIIVGAKAPIVVTSRGSGAEEKYLSLLLACMMADGDRKQEGEEQP